MNIFLLICAILSSSELCEVFFLSWKANGRVPYLWVFLIKFVDISLTEIEVCFSFNNSLTFLSLLELRMSPRAASWYSFSSWSFCSSIRLQTEREKLFQFCLMLLSFWEKLLGKHWKSLRFFVCLFWMKFLWKVFQELNNNMVLWKPPMHSYFWEDTYPMLTRNWSISLDWKDKKLHSCWNVAWQTAMLALHPNPDGQVYGWFRHEYGSNMNLMMKKEMSKSDSNCLHGIFWMRKANKCVGWRSWSLLWKGLWYFTVARSSSGVLSLCMGSHISYSPCRSVSEVSKQQGPTHCTIPCLVFISEHTLKALCWV